MKRNERIRYLRKANKMTQDDLASKLETTKQTIYKYETGAVTNIPSNKVERMAEIFGVEPGFLMGWDDKPMMVKEEGFRYNAKGAVKIPILGKVVAGLPISAYEDVLGFEEVTPEMAEQGELFALKVTGDSMYPKICDGDIVLVRVQPDVESEDVAVVFVNGDEATLKVVKKNNDGITIWGYNTDVYHPQSFSNKQIEELPVKIAGKVIELRRSF